MALRVSNISRAREPSSAPNAATSSCASCALQPNPKSGSGEARISRVVAPTIGKTSDSTLSRACMHADCLEDQTVSFEAKLLKLYLTFEAIRNNIRDKNQQVSRAPMILRQLNSSGHTTQNTITGHNMLL